MQKIKKLKLHEQRICPRCHNTLSFRSEAYPKVKKLSLTYSCNKCHLGIIESYYQDNSKETYNDIERAFLYGSPLVFAREE